MIQNDPFASRHIDSQTLLVEQLLIILDRSNPSHTLVESEGVIPNKVALEGRHKMPSTSFEMNHHLATTRRMTERRFSTKAPRATLFSLLWILLFLCILPVTAAFYENIGAPGDDTSLITAGSSNPDSVEATTNILNTNVPERFRSNRYGADFTYTLLGFVPRRKYRINIGFAELWSEACREGVRVFDVVINGAVFTDNLDVAKKDGWMLQGVGGNVPYGSEFIR